MKEDADAFLDRLVSDLDAEERVPATQELLRRQL
jgi:hypothetical protein